MKLTNIDNIIAKEQPRLFKLGTKLQKQQQRALKQVHNMPVTDARKVAQLEQAIQALGLTVQVMANYMTQDEEE